MKEIFQTDENFAGTKGLVFVGDQILVYRRDQNTPRYPGYLDVPGGGKEPDETPFDTFRREVFEEFGLTVHPENVVYSRKYQSHLKDNEFGWYVVANLPAEEKGNIVFGNEGTEWALMGLVDYIERKDAWPVYQQRAKDYRDSISSAT